MVREFEEETGAHIDRWDHFATVAGEWGSVAFFRSEVPDLLGLVHTTTDEPVECYRVKELGSVFDTLPNLSWLIPLALYRQDAYEPVVAMERTPWSATA
jgi:8-oxo-dGTP pyrophosphatase MutT (NUDIX family)